VWVLDDFETPRIQWRVESWACPGKTSLVKKGKNTQLKLEYTRTGGDKCAMRRYIPISWPFESRDEILIDVTNEGKATFQMTLAFFTKNGKGFYETTGQRVPPGEKKNVMYDLRSKRFKCAETGWANKSPLMGPETVTSVVLMVYPNTPGTIVIDNVRLVKKGKGRTK